MVDLSSKTPCEGLLPVSIGAFLLQEVDLGCLTALAPYSGQGSALSGTIQSIYGVTFPEPNSTSTNDNTQAIWFGRDIALLIGPAPDARLADHAALTDQSDAWAAVMINGEGSEDVLARLSPVDLRPSVFTGGQTCRTLLGHMTASITRGPDNSLLILVFRSMAVTLVDELQEAMEAVTARG